jgi:hypothetical protein
VVVSKGKAFGRAPQSAKSPWRFFFANFFLCADGVKEKSGRTETGSFTGKRKVTLSVAAYRQASGEAFITSLLNN